MRWIVIAVAIACASSARVARAAESCSSPVGRTAIVPCTLSQNLALRSAALTRVALAGRRTAANPIVPSNPIVSATLARRSTTGVPDVWNWNVGLSQEIEIAGQRGLRLDAADADIAAEDARTVVVKRGALADAYEAYFNVLGAHAEVDLAARLETVIAQVNKATAAMAEHGAASGVEADVVEAVLSRTQHARIEAQGRLRAARVTLTVALGLDPNAAFDAEGALDPLHDVDAMARSLRAAERAEVRALELDSKAWGLRAATFARSRVPNLTLSAFVENDGFNEQVYGLGVSIPIPFPQPIGRTYNGEIAEARALAERDKIDATRTRRSLDADTLRALANYDGRRDALTALPEDRVERAKKTLDSIADQVGQGRLAVRDAVVAQQALVDFILDAIRARIALCLASVDVARAASIPLERGGL